MLALEVREVVGVMEVALEGINTLLGAHMIGRLTVSRWKSATCILMRLSHGLNCDVMDRANGSVGERD